MYGLTCGGKTCKNKAEVILKYDTRKYKSKLLFLGML